MSKPRPTPQLLHDYAPIQDAAALAGITRSSLRRWLEMPYRLGPGRPIRVELWHGMRVVHIGDLLESAEDPPARGMRPKQTPGESELQPVDPPA